MFPEVVPDQFGAEAAPADILFEERVRKVPIFRAASGEVNVEVSITPDNGFSMLLANSVMSRIMIYDNISEQVKDHYFEFHPEFKHEKTEVVA